MRWVVRGGENRHDVDVEGGIDGYDVIVDGRRHQVELSCLDGAVASLRFVGDGRSFQVIYQRGGNGWWRMRVGEREFDLHVLTPVEAVATSDTAPAAGASRLSASIPGKVLAVKVASGDEVVVGQPLVVLEAMKMENELTAEQAGRVTAVHVEPGATVESGELLVELE
ncbi:MAG: biotin/lipoyl-containing protein [Thermoanaerobaculales bacterium]